MNTPEYYSVHTTTTPPTHIRVTNPVTDPTTTHELLAAIHDHIETQSATTDTPDDTIVRDAVQQALTDYPECNNALPDDRLDTALATAVETSPDAHNPHQLFIHVAETLCDALRHTTH